jgi:CRP/FNR family transcriptional regulator, cyclic AMP receptor protein
MSLASPLTSANHRSLLELDPGLAPLLSAERRDAATRELRVDVRQLTRGPLLLERLAAASPGNIGLLVLDGVVAREVLLGDTISAELLGAGDVIRPWSLGATGAGLEADVRWTVLSEHAHTALLDRRFARELAPFPEVAVALMDRLNERATRLATAKAVTQLTRVDRRLSALLWHLAERWGRVTADGVLLPLRLSHRLLAQLVGARRPTVSTALAELARTGAVVRRADGSWLLRHGDMGSWRAPAVEPVVARRPILVPTGVAA